MKHPVVLGAAFTRIAVSHLVAVLICWFPSTVTAQEFAEIRGIVTRVLVAMYRPAWDC